MQKLAYLNYPYEEFKTLMQFSFACFKLLDSFSSKSDSEKSQHEVLPDNCQLETFEICCVKLLLCSLLPTSCVKAPVNDYWQSFFCENSRMCLAVNYFRNKASFMNICSFQRIWSHLLKKSLMENFIFCAVYVIHTN